MGIALQHYASPNTTTILTHKAGRVVFHVSLPLSVKRIGVEGEVGVTIPITVGECERITIGFEPTVIRSKQVITQPTSRKSSDRPLIKFTIDDKIVYFQ